MTQIKRIHVLGVPVDCVDMMAAIRFADLCIREGSEASPVIAINPEKVIKARTDSTLLEFLSQAALVIPDGYGIVWAARLAGVKGIGRVPGCEFMPALCRLIAEKGYKVFLYGGRPEVNEQVEAVLLKNMPGLNIIGRCHGYLRDEEQAKLIKQINSLGPQVLFVALGSPAQEEWIRNYAGQLTTVRILQGVGGTFDVIAGHVKRAPTIFLKLNLEWFYRLLIEPKRIKRQLALPYFVWLVFKERFGVRV